MPTLTAAFTWWNNYFTVFIRNTTASAHYAPFSVFNFTLLTNFYLFYKLERPNRGLSCEIHNFYYAIYYDV